MQKGEIKNREEVYKASPKAKGILSGYCITGCGLVKIINGRCGVCGAQLLHEPTYKAWAKQFELVLERNKPYFDNKEYEKIAVEFFVKMDRYVYFILPEYFVGFQQIALNHDNYEQFFKHIQQVCPCRKV